MGRISGFGRRDALRIGVLGGAVLLAGCGAGWRVDYPQALDPAVTRGWRVADVRVAVPETLTTSDVNSWTPDYDIVWHGDPPGDRHAQVKAVMTSAIAAGAADLKGKQPVILNVTMQQFHAITPKVEEYLNFSGVHDIRFVMQILDARSGKPLTEPTQIAADTPALVGRAARDARARGYTQKQEVIDGVAKVIRGYLGTGPDPRHKFSRMGR
ncbi:DUF6778 family protein [Paenirhodobacter sp.]|uniref:DUF6778 family protein n=1 Tax=Paenirhodobacter sp. TaxID=1965326 RepID=UPI003B41A970